MSRSTLRELPLAVCLLGFFTPLVAAAAAPNAADEALHQSLLDQGFAAKKADDCAEAERKFAAAAKIADRFKPGDIRIAADWDALGTVQIELNEHAAADDSYRRVRDAMASVRSSDHAKVGLIWLRIARQLEHSKKRNDAEAAYKSSIAELKQLPASVNLGTAYQKLASLYHFEDRVNEAEPLYKKSIKILRSLHANKELSAACANQALFYSYNDRMPESWSSYSCALNAANESGLIDRFNRPLLVEYVRELREHKMFDDVPKFEAIIARIDALPTKAGGCVTSKLRTD